MEVQETKSQNEGCGSAIARNNEFYHPLFFTLILKHSL